MRILSPSDHLYDAGIDPPCLAPLSSSSSPESGEYEDGWVKVRRASPRDAMQYLLIVDTVTTLVTVPKQTRVRIYVVSKRLSHMVQNDIPFVARHSQDGNDGS